MAPNVESGWEVPAGSMFWGHCNWVPQGVEHLPLVVISLGPAFSPFQEAIENSHVGIHCGNPS